MMWRIPQVPAKAITHVPTVKVAGQVVNGQCLSAVAL